MTADSPSPHSSPDNSGLAGADDGSRRRRRDRSRRVLLGLSLGLGALVSLIVLIVFWVLPILAERGDLNALVESILRSSLRLDLQIGHLETEPLSRLAITHLSSVRTESEGRFRFDCDRISVVYSPWQLWAGRVEELIVVQPDLYLNLDEDLAGILEAPELPERPPEVAPGPTDDSRFGIGHFSLQRGSLRVKYSGQEFRVASLDVEVYGIGSRDALSFHARSSLLGADFETSGRVVPRIPQTRPARYRIPESRIEIRGLDLDPLLELLRPLVPGLEARGRVDLAGTLAGVWPERVEVELGTTLERIEADMEEPLLRSGRLELGLAATVRGELETIDFSLTLGAAAELAARRSTAGSAVRRELDVFIQGHFLKDEASGTLVIDGASYVRVPGVGRLTLEGEFRSLLDEPEVSLDLLVRDLDLDALPDLLSWTSLVDLGGHVRGRLDLDLHLGGRPGRPVLGVVFDLDRGELGWNEQEAIPVTVSGRIDRIAVTAPAEPPRLEGVSLALSGLDLGALARRFELGALDARLAGEAEIGVEVPSWEPPALPRDVAVRLRARSLALALGGGQVETEEADLDVTIDTRLLPAEPGERGLALESRLALGLRAPLLVVGEAFEVLEPSGLGLRGVVRARIDPVETSAAEAGPFEASLDLEAAWPTAGPVHLTGSVISGAGGPGSWPRLDLQIDAPNLSNARLLGTYLRDAYRETRPFLQESSFAGQSSALVRVRTEGGRLGLSGTWSTSDADVSLPAIGLEAHGVDVALPFAAGSLDAGSSPREGHIRSRVLEIGEVRVAGVDLPIAVEGRRYTSTGTRLDLLGGTVELRRIALGSGERPLDIELSADGLDLAAVTSALGVAPIAGSLDAQFRRATLAGDRIELAGELSFTAFGGRVLLRDLVIDHFAEPYFVLSLKHGRVSEIDLRQLGRHFEFGVISGVLQGHVQDLVFTPGHVVRFFLDLETVPRSGVPQFLDVLAIESIQRVIAGSFAGLETFFTRFRYHAFGFVASLGQNRFRLRGKYDFDGTEYLMYSRWWQFPRVSIINTRPDRDYDWRIIFKNLRAVFRMKERPGEAPRQ